MPVANLNNNEKNKGTKTGIRIKITGQMNDIENATQDLENLFSSLCTKKFDDKTGKKKDQNFSRGKRRILDPWILMDPRGSS